MDLLTFKFELDTSLSISKKSIRKRDGELLVAIEGMFEIWVGQNCFFSDPYMTLLELGVELAKWQRAYRSTPEDFYYFSMSHDESEGPILAFSNQENDKWLLSSIWQNFTHTEYINSNEINEVVREFLNELDKELRKQYSISIDAFIY